MLAEARLTPHQCFHQILVQKIQLDVFKLREKILKRKSPYTGLVDFHSFARDCAALSWTLEFLDKNEKCLYAAKTSNQANFEAGFSVVWCSFSDLDQLELTNMTTLRVYAQIPLSLDLKTGKIVFKEKINSGLAFNWKRAQIAQIDNINIKAFNNLFISSNKKQRQTKVEQILEDKLIKLFQVDRKFIFGIWNPNSKHSSLSIVKLFFRRIIQLKI